MQSNMIANIRIFFW